MSACACPSCGHTMKESTYEGHYGARVTIDECVACNGLWFDQRESFQLTPRSVVELFKAMNARRTEARAPQLPDRKCPRCRAQLTEVHDRVKNTAFTAHACPKGCGRFSSFVEFLREKELARDATEKEIEHLKERVRIIHCSSCGAPIDLYQSKVCGYCRAPVSWLGTDALGETLKSLTLPDVAAVNAARASTVEELSTLLNSRPTSKSVEFSRDVVGVSMEALLKLLT